MLRIHNRTTIAPTKGAAPSLVITQLLSYEVTSSWDMHTDTLTLQIPNVYRRQNENVTVGSDGSIKRGYYITVESGYYPTLNTRFTGYIRRVVVDNIITIEAEDSWPLKQVNNNYSLKQTTIQAIVAKITEGTGIDYQSVSAKAGDFRAKNVNSVQVLEELKKTYGLPSYIVDGVLKVGTVYISGSGQDHTLHLEGQGQFIESLQAGQRVNNGLVIDDNLEYIDATELQLYVEGKSMQANNQLIERYASYTASGELQITAKAPGGQKGGSIGVPGLTALELEEYVKQLLEQIYTTGVSGTVTTFGEPQIAHGDRVAIVSRDYPEKEGTFFVKKVTRTGGPGGERQVVELDRKV